MTREAVLARTLVELADTLVDDFDVVDLLTRLANSCVEILDVDAAGIMLATADGQLRVMASSSEAMRVLELFEVQAQEGPCLDCHRTGRPVVNQDLTIVDGLWPNFAPEALAAGFGSVHALPLRLRGTVIGALNLFRAGSGKMNMNPTWFATSTVGTLRPIHTPIHDIANVTISIRPAPARNSSGPAWTRQPTARPDSISTTRIPEL